MSAPKPATGQNSLLLSAVKRGHGAFVRGRRVRVLAKILAERLPQGASVLDIGCGDGTIAALIAKLRSDISMQGVEVLPRADCQIPCLAFDGNTLPFGVQSFDVAMLVDVLHHTSDVSVLLKEAARVSRQLVLLKDHLSENAFDHATLRFMDWVGNRPHGVTLTYNYQSRAQWDVHFAAAGLRAASFETNVPLYPAPFSALVGRGLHFIAALRKTS
ncbi:MAG TPA: class I SAM-dependent methyltransferase [Candidatus Dormibacteraeota bacterium]|nr:class I SAM-dependent methyltransferase [Candidatus Dormibacteraeota bacterium]